MTSDAEWLRTAADDIRRGYSFGLGWARRFEEIAERLEKNLAPLFLDSVPSEAPESSPEPERERRFSTKSALMRRTK